MRTRLKREIDLHFKTVQSTKLRHSEHFWKMRSEKCAPGGSEISISHENR